MYTPRGSMAALALSVVFAFVLCLPTASVQVSTSDMAVLLCLKEAWTGAQLSSWPNGGDCADFDGIDCNEDGQVTKLDLSSCNLTGPISKCIGNLSVLQTLQLSSNNLTESIPESIGKLNDLLQLNVSSNQLTGFNPEWIGRLSSLTNLDLSANQLTGFMPDIISNLSKLNKLRQMNLQSNRLTGSIPDSILHLSDLMNLDLSHNQITGSMPIIIERLSKIPSLNQVNLQSNRLTGSITESIGLLSSLTNLDLSHNQVTGSMPKIIQWLSTIPSLQQVNLQSNRLMGSITESIGRLSWLTNLDLSHNQLVGSIPYAMANLVALIHLDLSSNRFTGSIPQGIGNLSSLTYLDLSQNQLTGYVPKIIANLSALIYLDLHGNYLTGPLPSTPDGSIFDFSYNYFTTADYSSNATSNSTQQNCIQDLSGQRSEAECHSFCLANETRTPCGGANAGFCAFIGAVADCSCNKGFTPTRGSCKGQRGSSLMPGLLGGLAALLACAIIGTSAFCCWSAMRRRKKGDQFRKKLEAVTLQNYTRRQILTATANFSEAAIIGKGAYGIVYLGKASDGTPWAVKRLNLETQKMLTVFENEVHLVSSLRHQNLVALLGYHCHGNEQVLVYEYVPNGTLHDRIFMTKSDIQQGILPLSFEQRLEIMVGVARGVNYLHTFSAHPIVHRDIKASNILLDKDLQAKVADFGFSKSIQRVDDDEQISLQIGSAAGNTPMVGTPGYMDPEYFSSVKVTMKSDVYSFGVLMLELLTGKPAVMYDPEIAKTVGLARWALPFLVARKYESILDPQFSDVPLEKAEVVASVAKMCIDPLGRGRPTMLQVTRYLEASQGSTLLYHPGEEINNSSTFDSIDVSMNEILGEGSSSSSAFLRAPVSQAIAGR